MSDISNDVIARAAKGDMAAFEDIYRSTSPFVYNVALRITNNRDDADEVTQDVFVKVHRNLRGFGFRSSLKTWIYRITANTAINYCKCRARHVCGRLEYDPALHDREAPRAESRQFDKEEFMEAVEPLIDALDPDQRACIVLREIEGLDYRAIADTLHININTVRSRLRRARERLLAMGRKGR
ncbi:MAG: RNA polymerase sigma factor [Candidatus Omnitrophica bacterium]|nr:RNA polymerase sigma factor [Candidatus Omnitrophota bacterium]